MTHRASRKFVGLSETLTKRGLFLEEGVAMHNYATTIIYADVSSFIARFSGAVSSRRFVLCMHHRLDVSRSAFNLNNETTYVSEYLYFLFLFLLLVC